MWNGNQRGASNSSTRVTGVARHGIWPNSARVKRVKTLHVRRVRIIAGQLEGVVGLDRGAHVEIAVVEQGPAAVLGLNGAKIDGELGFQRVVGLAEKMIQQNVFGGDGGVGLKLK